MKKIILKYGLISGVILSIIILVPFMIAGNSIGYTLGEIIGYTTMILCMLAVYFGSKKYRDEHQDGKITFGRAFKVGLLIALVSSVVFGLFNYILYAIVDPDFLTNFADYTIEQIKLSGASQSEIDTKIQEYKSMESFWTNPAFQSILMFVTVLGIGAIISIISGLILSRKSAKA